MRIPSHPWGPGEHARYRDRDLFLAGLAMQSIYRSKEGDHNLNVWEMLCREVYEPIGVLYMHGNATTDGVPLTAWGAYPNVDDMVKIAGLVQRLGVTLDGEQQLLSEEVLREALYETGEGVVGLPTGASGTNPETKSIPKSYHLTLWHEPYVSSSGGGGGGGGGRRCLYSCPQMHGYGGNTVLMSPSGVIGFRVGTAGHPHGVEAMCAIADTLRPFDIHARVGGRHVAAEERPRL
jgi:hypothetical protein